MILSVVDRIYQFFEYTYLPGEQPDQLKLPELVKVSKKTFTKIKSKVQNANKKNYKLDQIGKTLLILTNLTNYLKT